MSRWRFLRRGRWDDERARELEAYLAIETDEQIARGVAPDDARLAARRKLGSTTAIREEIYRMNSLAFLDSVWQDLKFGARLLGRNPGFAAVAILSLALGIGANTAIFELIDAVRLRVLPVRNAQQIALIHLKTTDGVRGGIMSFFPAVTNPVWERLRDEPPPALDPFAWASASFDLADTGRAEVADTGLWASGAYFDALGVRPAAGRLFASSDDRRGCAPTAVLSHAFWQRRYGGDPSIVGRTLSINRHRVEILGVAEPGFDGLVVGRAFDVALPICAEPIVDSDVLDSGTLWWLTVMGRVKPGGSVEAASAQLSMLSTAIFERVPVNYPPESAARYRTLSLVAEPASRGVSTLREEYGDSLSVLLTIAGIVLLVAAANLANLMLARATARRREIAVRLALGASRGRVVRQWLAESALVAALGGCVGAVLAGTLGRALIAFLGSDAAPVALPLVVNWRVLAFVVASAAVCAFLFGLLPALRATHVAGHESLRIDGRGVTGDRRRNLARRVLVASQLALSLALVVCAFQFVATFRTLATLDPGFRQDGVVEASIDFDRIGVAPDRRRAFRQDLVDRIRSVPGVASAADVELLPVSSSSTSNAAWRDGGQRDADKLSMINSVGPGYFATLAIPLVSGRDFDPRSDAAGAPKVAVVNETFARQFLAPGPAVGQSFWIERTPSEPQRRVEVIGLVRDTKYRTLREGFPPIVFLTTLQSARVSESMRVVVRSDRPLAEVTAAVERAVTAQSPDVLVSFQVLATRIHESLRREQLMAALSGSFGVLAAVLAAIGLYGVLAYAVATRRSELGIRMALGASRRDVLTLIGREAGVLVAVGFAAGVALAIAGSTAIRALLFGVTPTDPWSLAFAIAAFGAVSVAASVVPAWRASRLEPTEALRES